MYVNENKHYRYTRVVWRCGEEVDSHGEIVTPYEKNIAVEFSGKLTGGYPTTNLGFITATKLGTKRSPPSMFKSKMVARKNPMVAWNIKGGESRI